MYFKSNCPYDSRRTCYHNACISVKTEVIFDGERYSERKILENVEITDSISAEELANCIMCELKPHMYDGMTVDEFCKLLKKYFGVASKYCCDLIQRMKVELDMYCPDRKHLYFV